MKNFEYAILGIPKGQNMEEVLVTRYKGSYITDEETAQKIANVCINEFKAENVRILKIDIAEKPDFNKTINI